MENYWYILHYNKTIYDSYSNITVFINKCKLYRNKHKRPNLARESFLTIEIINGSLYGISIEDTENKDCSLDGWYFELNSVIRMSKGHIIKDKFYQDHIKIVDKNFWEDVSNSFGISKKYPKLVEKILKKIG